ncbi:hypothetical protein M8J76_013911 [Diaphorina citri]|nr:hypothetical protein M8J75_012210 [Diaphorina citri]KAI5737464.1 hypothetical protein M8J76_013911 [Diaphorina citri]KAI5743022.1 hypothetical protein M8J77_013697 [Diaphorina citri]
MKEAEKKVLSRGGAGPAGGSNPPQPFFPQGLPPGFPPFPHGTPLQPGVLASHIPPTQQGHSPPPGLNFHKDERTQKQYNKLKKKLEQKQMKGENNILHSTPPLSPRKDLVNGNRAKTETSEDGEESSIQDEEDDASIAEILANVKSPQVAELSSRSALIKWGPPDDTADLDICESDLRYEVLLSDKGRDGKYKSIYNGEAQSCRIQDLKPGTDYAVCVQVHLEEIVGIASEPTLFTTPPCEPDQPNPPKLVTKTRTSLALKWNAAVDNGAHVMHYILESDQGNATGDFKEISKSKNKNFTLSKLTPSTCFRFRLAAVNQHGKSLYSDVVLYSTSGSPPSPPPAPTLLEAGTSWLRLGWTRRPSDEDYTLQMDDRESGHGFLAVYNGKETACLAQQLRHYTSYRFRLRASNDEGDSRWSDEVHYKTLPSRPGAPPRPVVKGRIHSKMFKIKWEPPIDRGGTDITSYTLELHSERGWNVIYTGSDTEHVCDRLNPGTTYQVRVCAESPGGRSEFSDPATVTTEPVCPGACNAPRLHGKPRQTSLTLRWHYPEQDGGSPVTELELLVRGAQSPEPAVPSSSPVERIAYKGRDTECTVGDLSPGTAYVFLLRAYNRIGHGPWSEPLEVKSGAAPPDTPSPPQVSCIAGGITHVEWVAPPGNGAPVSDYRLDMGGGDTLNIVYQGSSTDCDLKSIPPATVCHFRLQAGNSAGWSPFSETSVITTPPGPPGSLTLRKTSVTTPTSLTVSWSEPANHGSPILHYVLETSDPAQPIITCDTTSYQLTGLSPHTTYKLKCRAVNEVGPGPLSPTLRLATLQLPPSPPKLECSPAPGYNHLKLKWGEGRNSQFTTFTVYMENPRNPNEKHVVYQGTNFSCKVNKLQELTTYRFYITATNDAGQGPYSEAYPFTTCTAPPAPLKAPKISDIGMRTCTVEWQSARPLGSDPIVYCLQMSRIRDQDYKTVYRGSETRTALSELEGGAEYTVRVCPIRVRPDGDVSGSYSTPATFSTLPLPVEVTASALSTKQTSPSHVNNTGKQLFIWKNLSDQQMAGFIVLGLTTLAVFAAAIMQYCFIH